MFIFLFYRIKIIWIALPFRAISHQIQNPEMIARKKKLLARRALSSTRSSRILIAPASNGCHYPRGENSVAIIGYLLLFFFLRVEKIIHERISEEKNKGRLLKYINYFWSFSKFFWSSFMHLFIFVCLSIHSLLLFSWLLINTSS